MAVGVLTLLSSVYGNFLQKEQLRSTQLQALSQVTNISNQLAPVGPNMSIWPFVLSSSSSVLLFVLLIMVSWQYAQTAKTSKKHGDRLDDIDKRWATETRKTTEQATNTRDSFMLLSKRLDGLVTLSRKTPNRVLYQIELSDLVQGANTATFMFARIYRNAPQSVIASQPFSKWIASAPGPEDLPVRQDGECWMDFLGHHIKQVQIFASKYGLSPFQGGLFDYVPTWKTQGNPVTGDRVIVLLSEHCNNMAGMQIDYAATWEAET